MTVTIKIEGFGEISHRHYYPESELTIENEKSFFTELATKNGAKTSWFKKEPKLPTKELQDLFDKIKNAKSGNIKLSKDESLLLNQCLLNDTNVVEISKITNDFNEFAKPTHLQFDPYFVLQFNN